MSVRISLRFLHFAALVVGAVTVGLPALPGVVTYLTSSNSSRPYARVIACTAMMGCAGLLVASFVTSWPVALSGLIMFFGAWAPCNAMVITATARQISTVPNAPTFGVVFTYMSTTSLGLQTVVQAILFNWLNVSVVQSFRVMVTALLLVTFVLGLTSLVRTGHNNFQ